MMEGRHVVLVLSFAYQSLSQLLTIPREASRSMGKKARSLTRGQYWVQLRSTIDEHAAFLLRRWNCWSNLPNRLGSPFRMLACFCISTVLRAIPAASSAC